MPKIIPFPRIADSPQLNTSPDFLEDEIREELSALTSNPYLVDSILTKMKPLLEILEEEPEAIFELSEDGNDLKDRLSRFNCSNYGSTN